MTSVTLFGSAVYHKDIWHLGTQRVYVCFRFFVIFKFRWHGHIKSCSTSKSIVIIKNTVCQLSEAWILQKFNESEALEVGALLVQQALSKRRAS